MEINFVYGRARTKFCALDFLDNFKFFFVSYFVELLLVPGTAEEDAELTADLNSFLARMRQVNVGSGLTGIKVKGNKPVTRKEYLDRLLGILDWAFDGTLDDIRRGDFVSLRPGAKRRLKAMTVSFIEECVDLMMSTPAPKRMDVKPVLGKYLAAWTGQTARGGRKP